MFIALTPMTIVTMVSVTRNRIQPPTLRNAKAEAGERGTFLRHYHEHVRTRIVDQLSDDILAVAVRRLITRQNFRGTATELLSMLNIDEDEHVRKRKEWPKDAWHLSTRLRDVEPLLRAIDIDVTRHPGQGEEWHDLVHHRASRERCPGGPPPRDAW